MKKTMVSILICMFTAAILFGCSKPALPEGLGEDVVKAAAETCVAQLSAGDYEGVVSTMNEEMKAALPPDKLKEVFEPTREALGSFQEMAKLSVTAAEAKDGSIYGVATAAAKYENGTVTFTLSFDETKELAGLFFK